MTTIKELKEYLENFDDNMQVWTLNGDIWRDIPSFQPMEIPQDIEVKGHRIFIGYIE